jgi:hypothetical protein
LIDCFSYGLLSRPFCLLVFSSSALLAYIRRLSLVAALLLNSNSSDKYNNNLDSKYASEALLRALEIVFDLVYLLQNVCGALTLATGVVLC